MKQNLKIVVKKTDDNRHRFNVVSSKNGKIVLPSERYERIREMWKTIRSLRDNGLNIPVYDTDGNLMEIPTT